MKKITSLLLILLMAVGVKAQITETYDFYTWSKSSGNIVYSSESVTLNKVKYIFAEYATYGEAVRTIAGRIANATASVGAGNTGDLRMRGSYGLYNFGSGDRRLLIRNLNPGDKVTIKHWYISKYGSSTFEDDGYLCLASDEGKAPIESGTAITSEEEYLVLGDEGTKVNLRIIVTRGSCIQSITVETSNPETVMTPTYTLSVNGTERTVSIFAATQSTAGNEVTTRYTMDGTEPNSSEGTVYSESITISNTTEFKTVSYVSAEIISEVVALEVEAGTTVSLNSNIVAVTGFEGENNSPIISNVYTNDGVVGIPNAVVTVTFNGEEVELPYTVTEDGELVATASAEGYVATMETLQLYAVYVRRDFVDFTNTTTENLTEFEGGRWILETENMRWANWDKTSGDIYNVAKLADGYEMLAGDFLQMVTSGTRLLIGYGVGRDTSSGVTSFKIANPKKGEIAFYEVNETRDLEQPEVYTECYVPYDENSKLSYSIVGNYVVAKVSVYTPIPELIVADGTDFAPEYDYYTSATYTGRTLAADKYGTICLPFAPDSASLAAYNFYELTASTVSGTDGEVTFTKVAAPEANKPYIYCLADKDATEAPAITGGATEVSTEAGTTIISGWQMVGSFKAETVDCTDKAIYALNGETQKLMKVTQSLSVPAYRAYIEGTSSQLDLQMLTVRISGPTGIEQISAADVEGLLPATIYDLMGRPVQNPQKGHLYIQGGKKVVY